MLYAPWYVFVETHGGYAALLRHHRGYLNPPGWFGYLRTQLGEAHALSGPGYTGGLTGLMAWFAFEAASDGQLPERPWSLRGALPWGVSLGLLVLAFSFQAYYPWWLGLGLAPWLLTRERPAARLLGVWWTLMTVMTPLYHPYARLWMPLHALGWLLMAGVLTMLRPAVGGALADHGQGVVGPCGIRQCRLLVGVALACGVSAAIHVTLSRPASMPWSRVMRPAQPSLRQVAYQAVPHAVTREGTKLRVYANRPLAFYLALRGGYSIQLEPNSTSILERLGLADSWALVERGMPRQGGDHDNILWTIAMRKDHASYIFAIDPVTALDAHPEAAFSTEPPEAAFLVEPHVGVIDVWGPFFPDLNAAPDAGLSPTGPAHDPAMSLPRLPLARSGRTRPGDGPLPAHP